MTLPHMVDALTVYPLAAPGVYESPLLVGGRSVYFALGLGGVLLEARRGRGEETDAEVQSDLRTLYLAATRPPLALVTSTGVSGPSSGGGSRGPRRRRGPARRPGCAARVPGW